MSLKRISWMCSRSFIFEGSLRRVSMQPLFFLSPKKADAVEVKDFCHSSLVCGVYKIISKVLSESAENGVGEGYF
jgi:hypothetical protein